MGTRMYIAGDKQSSAAVIGSAVQQVNANELKTSFRGVLEAAGKHAPPCDAGAVAEFQQGVEQCLALLEKPSPGAPKEVARLFGEAASKFGDRSKLRFEQMQEEMRALGKALQSIVETMAATENCQGKSLRAQFESTGAMLAEPDLNACRTALVNSVRSLQRTVEVMSQENAVAMAALKDEITLLHRSLAEERARPGGAATPELLSRDRFETILAEYPDRGRLSFVMVRINTATSVLPELGPQLYENFLQQVHRRIGSVLDEQSLFVRYDSNSLVLMFEKPNATYGLPKRLEAKLSGRYSLVTDKSKMTIEPKVTIGTLQGRTGENHLSLARRLALLAESLVL
jgi:GGDEF domain-containing protein